MILSTPWSTFPQGDIVFKALFPFLFLCWGVWLVTAALRFRLTLKPHALILRRTLTTQIIARSDIECFKKVFNRNYGAVLWVQSRRRKRSSVAISWVFKEKDAVLAWFEGLPD
ncbi:hypothetical protein [Massilia antarctica]|uniref:hypothetical protein n=1 Tax=Massilia antarctica TaxID=2765360 RepID=UPI0006BB97A4|nr:hypothetical protein [Massilia sp. H27-R4]MCY0912210.1 hypothetical protein [Massilia sp. H27-R4]CUI06298.1 hypothetical protein BN2497_7373 [Janthinobacterium sp. CG23_2]CUU30084.1 hypothetical protein BN3177_7373 [Janthinobacterium sp. CG23_2]